MAQPGVRYEAIGTGAQYSPWNLDDQFIATLARVEGFGATLVDRQRCYELWTLVEQTAKLPGDILEVGVWKGGTGVLMAQKVALHESDTTVILCDTFSGIVKAGVDDPFFLDGMLLAARWHLEALVKDFDLHNIEICEGIFPDQTGHLIADRRFRLCHIDVDVYQSAQDILEWLWPRMVVGGVIVYDDFGFHGCPGIVKHVEEQKFFLDRLVLYNLNGHALVIKLK